MPSKTTEGFETMAQARAYVESADAYQRYLDHKTHKGLRALAQYIRSEYGGAPVSGPVDRAELISISFEHYYPRFADAVAFCTGLDA